MDYSQADKMQQLIELVRLHPSVRACIQRILNEVVIPVVAQKQYKSLLMGLQAIGQNKLWKVQQLVYEVVPESVLISEGGKPIKPLVFVSVRTIKRHHHHHHLAPAVPRTFAVNISWE